MLVGYARTSTVEQVAGFEAQLTELRSVGCEKIFQEQVSSVANRIQLEAVLEFVREGDTLVVTKLDRLARSTTHLFSILELLEGKGVGLKILNMGVDTHTPTGKLMLTLLGGIAQFEREMMLERQREGVAKAKSEGKYKGRKPISDDIRERVITLVEEGKSKAKVAKELSISEATVYRILNSQK